MFSENKLLLDIKGTFEIAVARNRLRQMTAKHQFPLMLQARAAAAITCVAEMVLFHAHPNHRLLHLSISVREEEQRHGIEFQFLAPLYTEIMQQLTIAEWQLENACDEIEISNRGANEFITMRLWARRKS